jgi:hypothetical protein
MYYTRQANYFANKEYEIDKNCKFIETRDIRRSMITTSMLEFDNELIFLCELFSDLYSLFLISFICFTSISI